MATPSLGDDATLFEALLALSAADRSVRLAVVERDAPALAERLRRLLRAHEAAGDFLGVLRADTALSPSGASTPGESTRRDTARAAPDGLRPDVTVGPFRLLRELGRGGMATVWLAHDARLDRAVALKFLGTDDRAPDTTAAERFLVEARAAAALDHPHVATVHEVGEAPGGRPYIAMVHCEGGSLAARLAHGALSVRDAIDVARQIVSALAAAHARGIVHRDVKPANVLFDATGRVRLTDFGIARLPGQELTGPGVLLGTLAYLSPEQVQGQPGDARSDLWALGVTTYEMLCGQRPFDAVSTGALLHAIDVGRFEPLDARRPEVPHALVALVQTLLTRAPAGRPASAEAVRQALDALASASLASASLTGASLAGASLAGATSPGASSTGPARPAGAPPPPAGPALVGREGDLASALALLGGTRLLTLTGPGGTGKTRLALELSRRAGAWFGGRTVVVRLAGVSEAHRVPETIARAVGLRDPIGADDADSVARHLGADPTLLVLDNFEHLLEAAPFVAALLEAASHLTIVVTSRAPLRVRAEQELPVPPLALPQRDDAATVGESAAGRLFLQRARASRPDFTLTTDNAPEVAELCRRLDGLPLALELAAARVRFLSPRALLARLERRLDLLRTDARDAEPRHRALRDVMAWSFALLTPEEQALFTDLGVFAGSITLEAATCVAGADASPELVLERLASLAEKSLLSRRDDADGEPRVVMLESVREFAREQLAASGRGDAVRARHAHWCARLADVIGDETGSPARARALARVQAEFDEVLTALAWSTGPAGDPVDALRIVGGLTMFWHWSGRWREGRAWAERALAAADAAAEARQQRDDTARPPVEREALGRTLQAAHLLAWTLGETAAALAHAERAARAWATLEADAVSPDVRQRIAQWATYTHCVSAFSRLALGDPAAAVRATDAGVAAAERAGGAWIIGFALGWRAMLRTTRGEAAPAAADLAAAERALRAVGDAWTLSWCFMQAAVAALAAGDPLAAARNASASVVHLRSDPDWHAVARGLEVMAAAAAAWLDGLASADPLRARVAHDGALLLGAAMASRERAGTTGWRADRHEADVAEATLRGVLAADVFTAAQRAGAALSTEAVLRVAEAGTREPVAWPLASWEADG